MARKEAAVERIKMILKECTDGKDAVCYVTSDDADALNTAIKTLEQEPCEDVVNRKAVLDKAWDVPYEGRYIQVVDVGDIEELPPVTPIRNKERWIPCSVRLPEEKDAGILKKLGTEKRSEYVLATVEVKGERMTVTACTYDGKWDWNMKYAFPDFKVVAWMPLPEPYKAEMESEE